MHKIRLRLAELNAALPGKPPKSRRSLTRRPALLAIGAAVVAALGVVSPAAVHSSHAAPSPPDTSMPRLVDHDGHYALYVDGAPYLMLGAQVNNSSAWPAMLPQVWPVIDAMGANTVEIPIYWQQFEPTQGHFDTSVLRVLLNQARQHHVRLVLLWFGLFKNGSGHYTPPWIMNDQAQVPHEVNAQGQQVDTLSPYSTFAMHAEATAFAALMGAVKQLDPQHTVIMTQVDNETGSYGTERDYSPSSNALFDGQVPQRLVSAMHKSPGTWSQLFGTHANEYFQAWYIASYINYVAAAGKAVYPLPMYANAALRDPFNPPQCTPQGCPYDAGGPTSDAIPVWKAAAPSLDILSPDIYFGDHKTYTTELGLYARQDNALFVPETLPSAQNFFAALGSGAIGWSPFGMDETGYPNGTPTAPCAPSPVPAAVCATPSLTPNSATIANLALVYEMFRPMDGVVAQLNANGKLQAIAEDPAVHTETLHFGRWNAVVEFGAPTYGFGAPVGNPSGDGGAMVAQLGPDQFLVSAVHARVSFQVADAASGQAPEYVSVRQGFYTGSQWRSVRTWNGDQTDYGLNFTTAPQVLQVTMGTYPLHGN